LVEPSSFPQPYQLVSLRISVSFGRLDIGGVRSEPATEPLNGLVVFRIRLDRLWHATRPFVVRRARKEERSRPNLSLAVWTLAQRARVAVALDGGVGCRSLD